jgi:hypothetical protein
MLPISGSQSSHPQDVSGGLERQMDEDTSDLADEADRAAKISVFSDRLLATFGARACDVVERQIQGGVSADARATWVAIWYRLRGLEAPEHDPISKLPVD